jgi:FkbM family methyltransferase
MARQYRYFELELGRIDDFVPSDRGAVDVGVWWGPWSWWLARRVPRVDAFEANPDLVTSLRTALPSNVVLHSVALGQKSTEAELWVPAGGMGTEGRATLEEGWRAGSGGRLHTVDIRRLDDFDLTDVGFLKIDVEGHEFPVLQGATHLLVNQRPTLMVEIEERSHHERYFDEIIEFLGDYGYQGSFLRRRRWHPLEEFDRQEARALTARVAQHGYATNFALYARRHIHNFLFTAVEKPA